MQRYFVQESGWKENQVIITGQDVHHINKVMRLNEGDQVICNHPDGYQVICEIISSSPNEVHTVIRKQLENITELPVSVTIAQGLPKGDKIDYIVQKGTELGAASFLPFEAERSIVVWDDKKKRKKISRMNKIAKEAGEQSHRNKIPHIHPVMSFAEMINETNKGDLKLFAYEEEAKTEDYQSLSTILREMKNNHSRRITICIGPEGGFSLNEANMLREHDFQPVRLGPRILRTETASLYALASISYHFEELGCT
ncbi:16S rRNA (uracil(1498)-N(3))-methyltransferase [Virgibacillus kimchii]